jgi:hypothetical protein
MSIFGPFVFTVTSPPHSRLCGYFKLPLIIFITFVSEHFLFLRIWRVNPSNFVMYFILWLDTLILHEIWYVFVDSFNSSPLMA